MITISNEQLEWMFNSPGCRTTLKSKVSDQDVYCAAGKFALLMGADMDNFEQGQLLFDKKGAPFWGTVPRVDSYSVAKLNDRKEGNFQDNHIAAVKMIIQQALQHEYIQLENDKYAHEFANLCQGVAV